MMLHYCSRPYSPHIMYLYSLSLIALLVCLSSISFLSLQSNYFHSDGAMNTMCIKGMMTRRQAIRICQGTRGMV